jgi:hypothetical protein
MPCSGGNRQRQRHAPHQPRQDEGRRRRGHGGAPRRHAEHREQQREQERGIEATSAEKRTLPPTGL